MTKKILYIEDSPTCAQATIDAASDWEVTVVESGSKALKLLREAESRQETWDAVIIDYNLPDVTNGDLVRMIRLLYDHCCPIVIYTATPDRAMAGCPDVPVVAKPRFDELLSLIGV